MSTYRYEAPFRKPYEFIAVASWTVALVATLLLAASGRHPKEIMAIAVLVCAAMALWRLWPALKLRDRLKRLAGTGLTFISLEKAAEKLQGQAGMVWLGTGFAWGQKEAQRALELMRADEAELTQPKIGEMGKRWIHAMADYEHDLYVPIEHLEGHLNIFGATGSGKTRLLDHLISQAIMRNEAVIVIDPKGDRPLYDAMRQTCASLGQAHRFKYFHPAFPGESVRLDPLKNFNRATELATRVAALIRGEGGNDPFSSFAQQSLKSMIEGLLIVNDKPNLIDLRRFIEGGPAALVCRAIEAHLNKVAADWRGGATAFIARAGEGKRAAIGADDKKAIGLVAYYRSLLETNPNYRNIALEGLIGQFEHDRSHYGKMVASLIPMLHMLTSGEIGPLLSPDASDKDDHREITDLSRIVKNGHVLYIGLDNLSDVMVGSAIGALFCCDMAAVAGDRYNYGEQTMTRDDLIKTTVFVDEASFIPPPMIEVLNKGRGARFSIVLASQDLHDYSTALGSMDRARQVLANTNNLIALRSLDRETQEYICESFEQVVVRTIERSQSISSSSEAPAIFSGSTSERLGEEKVLRVEPATLGSLPNLEFFARVSGGKVFKGKIPILEKKAA